MTEKAQHSADSEAPPPSDPFGIVGRVVDARYLVEGVAGSGGFGVVYRARHLRFSASVALKVLRRRDEPRGSSDALVERVQTEGRLLFDLAPLHPSFVRVFETGVLTSSRGPAAFLVLEWLEGETLAAHQKRRGAPFALAAAIDLLHDVAAGLAVAHAERVAHRDVKPANIFLSRSRVGVAPKILDLGLAKVMSESALASDPYSDSGFGGVPFTPVYAAPEQWSRRLGATGSWTDVYALASVLVELLAGRRPQSLHEPSDFMAVCLNERERPTPRSLGVPLADAVEQVFERALAIEPRQRFRDAGEFWRALCAAANIDTRSLPSSPQRSVPAPSGGAAPELESDDQVTTSQPAEDRTRRPRKRSPRLAIAALTLLASAFLLFWFTSPFGRAASRASPAATLGPPARNDLPRERSAKANARAAEPYQSGASPSAERARAKQPSREARPRTRPSAKADGEPGLEVPPPTPEPEPAASAAEGVDLRELVRHETLERRY
jgi:serine/threonine-protein kinase